MIKHKPSGVAVFMYCVIAFCAITAAVCFALNYTKTTQNGAVLWVGIVAFMIVYHLWLRIIMGNVTKLFNISYQNSWFNECKFEKKLYKILKVKKWKGKALTYNPELFSIKNNSLEDIATTMAKSETDHWVNEAISATSILFSLVWGAFPVFLITALGAMAFDAQFIVIQRYNRPRVLNLMSKMNSSKNIRVQFDFSRCNK